jgi:hypothetical protein
MRRMVMKDALVEAVTCARAVASMAVDRHCASLLRCAQAQRRFTCITLEMRLSAPSGRGLSVAWV